MNADIASLTAAPSDPTGRTEPPAPTNRFRIQLSATPRGARLARHLAAQQLDAWGWPYDTEANRTAALLVAELAANAVRHGRVQGRDFRLTLTLCGHPDQALRIEVTDACTARRPPTQGALTPPAPEAESGRGLLIVETLAGHWGTTCEDPYTKTVWCEVPLPRMPEHACKSAPHPTRAAREVRRSRQEPRGSAT